MEKWVRRVREQVLDARARKKALVAEMRWSCVDTDWELEGLAMDMVVFGLRWVGFYR